MKSKAHFFRSPRTMSERRAAAALAVDEDARAYNITSRRLGRRAVASDRRLPKYTSDMEAHKLPHWKQKEERK
jgi:hypothetical protein